MGGWGKISPAAQDVGVSARTLRNWLHEGLKHSRLPAGTILIKFTDLNVCLEQFAVTAKETENLLRKLCKDFQRE